MSKFVKFTNTTNKVFEHTFGGEKWTFRPNEQVTLEEGQANFFAKHLATREFKSSNKPGTQRHAKKISDIAATYIEDRNDVTKKAEAEVYAIAQEIVTSNEKDEDEVTFIENTNVEESKEEDDDEDVEIEENPVTATRKTRQAKV